MAAINFSTFAWQWPGLLPPLVVYVAGSFIALANWRVCPRPAALTLGAMLLFILLSVSEPSMMDYLSDLGHDDGWRTPRYRTLYYGIYSGVGFLRAIGSIMTITAAFQARRPPPLP